MALGAAAGAGAAGCTAPVVITHANAGEKL